MITTDTVLKRGKYAKLSVYDRQRLIQAYEREDDFVEKAKILGIKRSTAYSIVSKYIKTGEIVCQRNGGNNHTVFTDEINNFVIQCLESNCLLTLKEINAKIRQAYLNKKNLLIKPYQII